MAGSLWVLLLSFGGGGGIIGGGEVLMVLLASREHHGERVLEIVPVDPLAYAFNDRLGRMGYTGG